MLCCYSNMHVLSKVLYIHQDLTQVRGQTGGVGQMLAEVRILQSGWELLSQKKGAGKKQSKGETWASWWGPPRYCENHEHRKSMEKGKCMHKLLQQSPPLQDSLGEIVALLKTWSLPLNSKQQECPSFLLTLLCLPAKREVLLAFARFCISIFQIFSEL